jgi:hypothetical protein
MESIMDKTVINVSISEKKVIVERILLNILIIALICASALLRGDTRLIALLAVLFIISSIIELIIFYNYSFNEIEVNDSQLILSRGEKCKYIDFNEIDSIIEGKNGIKIILKNKSKYRIIGNIINTNNTNSDYSKKSILVNEIEKRSKLTIKYNKRRSWL